MDINILIQVGIIVSIIGGVFGINRHADKRFAELKGDMQVIKDELKDDIRALNGRIDNILLSDRQKTAQ